MNPCDKREDDGISTPEWGNALATKTRGSEENLGEGGSKVNQPEHFVLSFSGSPPVTGDVDESGPHGDACSNEVQ